MLGISCSPNRHGVTSLLGPLISEGYGEFEQVSLLSLHMRPCMGCQTCMHNGGQCVLPRDDASQLFELIARESQIIFFSPIYFYALPWLFKIFIDRSQKYWGRKLPGKLDKSACVILAAGRIRGENLFSGALLTIRYFLEPFGYRLETPLLLRGLESRKDMTDSIKREIVRFGEVLAARNAQAV